MEYEIQDFKTVRIFVRPLAIAMQGPSYIRTLNNKSFKGENDFYIYLVLLMINGSGGRSSESFLAALATQWPTDKAVEWSQIG